MAGKPAPPGSCFPLFSASSAALTRGTWSRGAFAACAVAAEPTGAARTRDLGEADHVTAHV